MEGHVEELQLTKEELETLQRFKYYRDYREKQRKFPPINVPHEHEQLAKAMWDYIIIEQQRVPNEKEWALISKVISYYNPLFKGLIGK